MHIPQHLPQIQYGYDGLSKIAFVKDNYFSPEGVEVDNEDFIRRWNGAYEVLNVQD